MRKVRNKSATALVRKYGRAFVTLSLVVLVLVFLQVKDHKTPHLKMGGETFAVEFADSQAKQAKGLGDRDNLALDHAMLFRFMNPGAYCFWMKDMRFNLDILWLTANKKINHIETNISPSTYPHSYCPTELSQYVLEVNAGIVQSLHVHEGDSISF